MSTLYVWERATLFGQCHPQTGAGGAGRKKQPPFLSTAYPLPNRRIWHEPTVAATARVVR
jgi:hypothetical protein